MTDWKLVQGSQTDRPLEVDTCSSTTTVYLRRNITQVEKTEENGDVQKLWEYEECTMTQKEYASNLVLLSLLKDAVNSITSYQKQDTIDEYTMQLVEEGVL